MKQRIKKDVKPEGRKDPRDIRQGYHLVRVNSHTEIEVKDGADDQEARKAFIEKMAQHDKVYYNNLEVQMAKTLELEP